MPTMHDNVLSWASDAEDATLAQAAKTARLPFIEGHVALMPDAHIGFGSTIGSVIPTKGAVVPSAVGVDIGCGMVAAQLPANASHLPDDLGPLLSRIAAVVPAGVGQGHDKGRSIPDPHRADLTAKELSAATRQIGSLGSGNHFVEVCLDEDEAVWVVLHSGSRGVGNRLATRHIEGAKAMMKRWFIDLPDPDLAYLVEGTAEFDAYIAGMLWAQDYAFANRETMMMAVLEQVALFLGREQGDFLPASQVNCHHNFTERENHRGQNVLLTRKGAIRARVGDRGVIPGSMGTRSYIVTGRGNPASYDSCSHGAGRRMSRGAARRSLDVESFRASMTGKTWLDGSATDLLDEDPRAYKDIDQVMADQADLVTVDHVLTQVLNYKGL